MSTFRRSFFVPHPLCRVRVAALLILVWGAIAAGARGQGMQSVPSQVYFLALPAFYNGEYAATGQIMAACLGSAIKNPAAGGFWIDSICYETLQGECAYHVGNHSVALLHYQNALRLRVNFANWLVAVQFPPVVTPALPQNLKPIPWYLTQRQTVIGAYPLQMNIFQGNVINNQVLIQGGVAAPPVLLPIYAQEIVRCTCLAIRRWRELLGPTCPHNQMTRDLVQALAVRPALPNHWSEAWIDTELGLAYAAAGKVEQARKQLAQAELAMGTFDHPFTGTCLLQMGLLDLEGGDYKSAERNFLEASWAAANYNDVGVVEEALRYATLSHYLLKGREPYPILAPAIAWATAAGLGQLNATLLLSSAENLSQIGQPVAASAALGQATVLTSGTNMPVGKIGARMNHLRALVAFQMGQSDAGDAALFAAMAFQAAASLRLYHIGLVDILFTTDQISPRDAVTLYSNVLRDPAPTDWLIDPLEALSVLYVPHPLSYENWFLAALARGNKEEDLAFQIAEMAKRHRFLVMVEEGGRLLNLRWLLEAPEAALDNAALLQRQALLALHPAYQEKFQRVRTLRMELKRMPLLSDDQEQVERQAELLKELATLSVQQEAMLREMSVSHEPANLVFPPLRSKQQVQESLTEGQSLLVFFVTTRGNYSFLLAKDKYGYSEVKPPKRFFSDVTSMLQKWGNYGQNKEMKLEELVSNGWQVPAQHIMSTLVKSSKADFTKTLDELIIVPDGMLWYIPFEALPVADGDKFEPLINRVRIRYAPTAGLAMGDKRRRSAKGNLAVALGRLYPQDDAAVIEREFEDLARALPRAEAIHGKLPAHGAIFSSLFDRLIVLNEVPPSAGFDWSPLQLDNKSAGGTLGQWLTLPFDGPDQVILPGFRTAAEKGLARTAKDANGNELFLTVCGLMAGGARTVLISRWRTGGQTSVDLVREFTQELPHTVASDAWQRSIQLVMHSQVNPGAEPRMKRLGPQQEPPDAKHPFFWAGYLLADTGALPMTDEEEEAAEKILIAKPADAKPADAKPAEGNANAKGMDQDPVPPAAGKPAAAPVAQEKAVRHEQAAPAEKPAATAGDGKPEAIVTKPGKPRRGRPSRGPKNNPG